jgi:hypothetical protein
MLRNMLEERNAYITTMKSEIYRKEYRNDTQKVDLQSQILQKDAALKKLEVRALLTLSLYPILTNKLLGD